jgi:glycosyltransferase involved in cell wall biosynthesis
MPGITLSVIICTHSPDTVRLQATLHGLRKQTPPPDQWETIIVNNASTQFPDNSFFAGCAPNNLRIIPEPTLGLTAARRCGLRAANGEIIIFADDDNVLAPDYLAQAQAAFARLPRVGAIGGKSLGKFAEPPPPSLDEFHSLLAIRDLGDSELISNGLRQPGSKQNTYPLFAPIGAGMAIRREAIQTWLKRESALSDRKGNELTSSGDNDIVLAIMEADWEVAYIPHLSLNHLIPSSRLDPNYLARLNRGIRKSWVQVLLAHDACPWPQVSRWTVPLRQMKAWFTYRAWTSPAARIRWQGACGHFEGLVKA